MTKQQATDVLYVPDLARKLGRTDAAIRQAILDRAAGGAAVVVISQDLDELLEVSDTFAVLNEGRLTKPVPVQGLTMDQIKILRNVEVVES